MSFCETQNDIRVPDWVAPKFRTLFQRVICKLPAFPDRKKFAAVWSEEAYELDHRTIEPYPLATRRLNGRACYDRQEIVEYQFRRLVEAAVVRGGHLSDLGNEATDAPDSESPKLSARKFNRRVTRNADQTQDLHVA